MKKILDIAWFVAIYVLAITLIEAEGTTYLLETAGNVFGALGLIYIGADMALS